MMRMAIRVLFLLLALGPLAGCGGAAEARSGPWISQSPGWVRQPDASVAAAADGLVALTWIDVAASGSSAIGYAFSTDDGASFAPPSVLASPGGARATKTCIALGSPREST